MIEYVGEIIDVEESRKRLRESGQSGVTNYYILSLDKVCSYLLGSLMKHHCLFGKNASYHSESLGLNRGVQLFT